MESDSDSDGSHISATPPKPKPPPKPTLVSSYKSRLKSKSKARKLFSEPAAPTVPDPKPDPKPEPEQSPLLCPDLPFQILRQPPGQTLASPAVDSFVTPGFFSKSASSSSSISKNRRVTAVDFDPDSYDPPSSSSSAPKSNPNIPEADSFAAAGSFSNSAPSFTKCRFDPSSSSSKPEIPAYRSVAEHRSEAAKRSVPSSAKVLNKNVNLIRGNIPLPAVKLKGGGSEANFVKLNLRGRKRKFLNRGKRGNNTSSYGRKQYFRKGKRKLRANGEEGDEEAVREEESGLVANAIEEQQNPKKAKKFDAALFEEAVLAARNEASDENLLSLLRMCYGYDSFREGQLEAIRMVLAGDSTMLVLPTGAGKSLCYQLPSVVLAGVTLVVSPLIALMIDQLKQLPHMIRGGLLCSSQTLEEASGTIRMVQEGAIKVLFVSPERFLNGEFLSIFSATPISLVVVDEAHCVSEWSHNFRPSYMRLRASMLRAKLNVNCILAMTATATTTTLKSVMSALEIPATNLIQKANIRDNLQLSVSSSGNRMKDLLKLIQSASFKDQSIIIYCKFQFETEMISRYLYENNINAKCYHGGMLSKDRTRVQELFFSNKIRVVVATVAFGMGLDKRDIGSVIHYTLPDSLEGYVQEIGRAGRDGRASCCHLYLDDGTYFKLRSLMYSDGVDEYVVNNFLSQVFTGNENLEGKICSLVKEPASRKFDMKEEVMLTILTQLELGEVQYLHLLPEINVTCTLNFHKTPPVMLAEKNVLIAAILKKSENRQGQYVFDIPAMANSMGVTTAVISHHLQNLKLQGEVTYEVKDKAYCYTIVEVPADLCSLSAQLTKWLSEVESCKVRKLDAMFNAAVSAVNTCEKTADCSDVQQTLCLQRKILEYFSGDDDCDIPNKMGKSSPFLQADVKVFLRSNGQAKFTPRAIARIMHGIPSPAYSSAFWSKTHFWGRYTNIDFHTVMEAAKAELINFVRKDAV